MIYLASGVDVSGRIICRRLWQSGGFQGKSGADHERGARGVSLTVAIIILVILLAISAGLKLYQKSKDDDLLSRRRAELDAQKRRRQGLR